MSTAAVTFSAEKLANTTLDTPQQESPCGAFQRVRKWHVPSFPGIIVQHVTREFDVTRLKSPGGKITGGEIDDYVQGKNAYPYATNTEYWELWVVDNKREVSDGGDDTFALCAIAPKGQDTWPKSTKGTFKMKGEARFYSTSQELDDPDLQKLGFKRGAVGAAGGLYSTTVDPSTALAKLTQVGSTIVYEVTSTWDTSSEKPKDWYSDVKDAESIK